MPGVHDCYLEGITGVGSRDATVAIIGIAPGRDEWRKSRRPFTGQSGKLLDGLIEFAGFKRDDIFTTNLICWWNDKPDMTQIGECMSRLMDELASLHNLKLIVCLGDIVTDFIMAEQNHTPAQLRHGVFWSETYTCWTMATFHPAAYMYSQGNKIDIADGARDFAKLKHVVTWPPDYGTVEIHIVESLQEADDMMQHFADPSWHSMNDVVAIDVETYYDGHAMQTIAFSCEHGTYHIPEALVYGPHYEILNQSPVRWCFHNGQFDTVQIKRHLGVSLAIEEDTMLQSYSLDERGGQDTEVDSEGQSRAVGVHGLKRLVREYCAGGFYGEDIRGQINTASPEDVAVYNGSDAAYTWRLQQYFEARQIEDGVRDMYLEHLIPAANVMADITAAGVYIDQQQLAELATTWMPEWLDLEQQLCEDAQALGWPTDEINLNSPPQISKLLYDINKHKAVGSGKAVRSTAMGILKIIQEEDSDVGRWCNKLLTWRGRDHDIGTWITGLEPTIDAKGFAHPECLLHGARTGRTSYHNPPVQTVPKPRTVGEERARIRRIFAAPPPDANSGPEGYVILEADFRQAELWAAAMVSEDPVILEDLRSGDFHARVAEASFHVTKATCDPLMWELYRDSSKILVYGKFYGAGPDALMGAKAIQGRGSTGSYVLFKTKAEAEAHIKNFDNRYLKYAQWRDKEKAYVTEHGEQQSATGRKRRYFLVTDYKQLNQAINMPISSLSHDFLLTSLVELHPLLSEFYTRILFEVHDSIVMQVPKRYLKEVVELTTRIMQKPRFGFSYGIPVDMKAGPNWFDVHNVQEVLDEISSAI